MLSRPKAVVFDWDNTLVDTWTVIHAALVPTFEALGYQPWTLEECRQRVRGSARDTFPALFGDRAAEATKIFYDTYDATHLERLRPLDGAEALLEDLAKAGFYLGVVSNKRGDVLRKEAERLGWDRWFKRLIGSKDAARDKPSPDPVHLALEAGAVVAGREVWFVGDTDIDLECAVNAGCIPVLLRPEAPGENEFAHPPQLHFADCLGLKDALCRGVGGV